MHLGLEAGDVTVAEVFTELVHLLQLQQVNPQHLDRLHHLHNTKVDTGISLGINLALECSKPVFFISL